ncbi:MAG: LacI family DNA-binding transcriptional regulator [Proteobacteria bacterium]|nr:LacI family DNA-binding transcriptional regulator [Pseudomonadota bacterium]
MAATPAAAAQAKAAVTVKDVAAAAGVSVATVSNVLNRRPNVGHAIRAKVLRISSRLGYRPNRAAQAMRTGRTRAIGLVLPDLTNPFFPELAQAVESTARGLGLAVCLVDSQGEASGEADGLALLTQHAVDGIICCPVGARLPAQLRGGRPVVLIDRPLPGYAVVHANYLMGGELLARYALRMGHRRVGLLSGPTDIESARQRRAGFVGAFTGQIAWEIHLGFDGVLNAAARAALKQRGGATLVVCGNDLIAISAMRCLAELGVGVPQDMSVMGFDNIRWTDLVMPRLTTIAQPVGHIGARAVQLMQQRLDGAADLPPRGGRTVFDVALIERESVRNLAHK